MRLSAPIFRLKRQAKLLAREEGIALNAALDRVARGEGFRSWSHLAASLAEQCPAAAIFSRLNPGDLVLLGARPGHGKTLLGLELLVEAVKRGRCGHFFTLEYNERDVLRFLQSLGLDAENSKRAFALDTSDDICADHVIAKMSAAPGGAVAVIDYLQLMDQRRCNPELGVQIGALRDFARSSGAIIVALSQIHRAFELRSDALPQLADVRLPNPLDLSLFTKACFLHNGEVRLEAAA